MSSSTYRARHHPYDRSRKQRRPAAATIKTYGTVDLNTLNRLRDRGIAAIHFCDQRPREMMGDSPRRRSKPAQGYVHTFHQHSDSASAADCTSEVGQNVSQPPANVAHARGRRHVTLDIDLAAVGTFLLIFENDPCWTRRSLCHAGGRRRRCSPDNNRSCAMDRGALETASNHRRQAQFDIVQEGAVSPVFFAGTLRRVLRDSWLTDLASLQLLENAGRWCR